MKHKLLFFIAGLLTAVTASAQFSGSGDGTSTSPYCIYNEVQLYQVGNFLNKSDVWFKLMKDLDLSSFIDENYPSEGWMPIGVEATPFKGHFDGNNHKLTGIWINKSSISNVGFFGYLDGAVIDNLTLEGSAIVGVNQVGTLAGYAKSATIRNCAVTLDDKVQGTNNVGGFVGQTNACTIMNCNATISNKVYGTKYVGGFAGQIGSTNITSATVNGNVSGNASVGGIVGYVDGTQTLEIVTHVGGVSGTANVSGIAGELRSGSSTTFTSCFSKGKLTNTGDYTGGIVALSNGVAIAAITDCCRFGDIDGKQYTGGLIGGVIGNTDITNGVSDTNVYISTSSSGDRKIASKSIFDFSTTESIINNCLAIGNINGTSFTGGLVGKDEAYSLTCSNWIAGGSESISTTWTEKDNSDSFRRSTAYIWFGGANKGSKNVDQTSQYGELWSSGWVYWHTFSVTFSPNISFVAPLTYTNSYYSGIINGTDNVGGIAGYKKGGKIQYCYTNASIYADNQVGGIVGDAAGISGSKLTIESNVAINGTVSATVANIGRIYGRSDSYTSIGALGSATGNRALTTTKVIKEGVVQKITDNLQNGYVMGPSLLRLKANYVALGWNFDENWTIMETESYPYKNYQAAPPKIESELVSHGTTVSGSSLNGGTIYMYYRNNEAVSAVCSGNAWSFTTEPLRPGSTVQLYADVENMIPSYLVSSTVGYPGKGTEADPYQIYTAEDLQGVSNQGCYKIMNNIDLTAWISENSPQKGWLAVGRNSGESTSIDGGGHKITGLWINTTEDYTGLFSNCADGSIKNLTVEVASGKSVKGGDYTGILTGRHSNGQITNCHVKGNVEGTGLVGGIAGYSENNTVQNVSFSGSVSTATASAKAGGYAGQSVNDQLSQVRAITTLSVTNTGAQAGGVVGHTTGGTLAQTSAETDITVSGSGSNVGGLAGYSESAISESFTTGMVTCTGADSYTGGLVGMAKNSITDCYSTANVTGTQHTAGLCAYTYNPIDKCYAKGNIEGAAYGAGVVSQLDGSNATITNSVALNNIITLTYQTSWGTRVIGGFKNGASEPNETNFALDAMQVSLNGVPQKKTDDNLEGIAKPSSELMSKSFYSALGWDMTSIWDINNGTGYPYLRFYNAEQPQVETYTVTWKNYDGTVLEKDENVEAGTMPAYNGATPVRPADAQYTYTFSGWSPAITQVTGDATYTATYTQTPVQGGSDEDLDLQAGGELLDGGEPQQFGTLTQHITPSSAASIIACGDNLSADMLKVQVTAQTGTWLYLMFPTDISFSQISVPGQYVVYGYDGALRAQNGANGSAWSKQSTKMTAYQGYILQASQSGDFVFSIANPVFPCGTQTTSLPVQPSDNATDANWTLTGNPFPSYFNLQALYEAGFNAPVYVRCKDKDDYDVYRPQDDDYYFRPYEAFFVQNPGTTAATLQWLASGRLTESQLGGASSLAPRRAPQDEQNRLFVELSLNSGKDNGHTRLVFNDEASTDYELGRDAVRMNGNAPVRIYTLDAQTRYAINERPLEGSVSIGYTVEKNGVYTLSATRMDTGVEIYDNLLNKDADLSQGGYEFFAEAGTDETRFTLRAKAKTPTEISDLTDGNGPVSIYTPNGMLLYENVMMSNVTLLPGVYVIKSENGVRKVVIR